MTIVISPDDRDPVVLDARRYLAMADRLVVLGVGLRRRTQSVRPISSGVLSRYFSSVDDGADEFRARGALMRSAFTQRWWHLSHTSQRVVTMEPELFDFLLWQLVMLPGFATAHLPDERCGELARYRCVATAAGIPLSIDEAIAHTLDRFGYGWYRNPRRWRTSDGTPPAALVWTEAFAIVERTVRPAFSRATDPTWPAPTLDRAARSPVSPPLVH